jgi:hypothetical protein
MSLEDAGGDVLALAREARASLRESCEPEVGRCLNEGIKRLSPVLAKLITATERLADPSRVTIGLGEDEDIFGLHQDTDHVAAFRDMLETRGVEGRTPDERTFAIKFPAVVLSEDDIWPEGDGPAHPLPEDVLERMKEENCATPASIAVEWLLIDNLQIVDEEGMCGVTWEAGE